MEKQFPASVAKVLYNLGMEHEEELCGLDALHDGKTAAFFPRGLPLLLVRLGGEVFALRNSCAHMGCPLTGAELRGGVLTCPCHDWRFDVRGGRFLDAPELSLQSYPVAIRNGKVFVRTP